VRSSGVGPRGPSFCPPGSHPRIVKPLPSVTAHIPTGGLRRMLTLYHPTNRMKAQGRFIVVQLFPLPDGEVHYRIRSENDAALEYTADASELRASVPPRLGGA
jgi:hypothetical protein